MLAKEKPGVEAPGLGAKISVQAVQTGSHYPLKVREFFAV